MYRYIISSLIAIVMMAAVFLAWIPQAKAGVATPETCCEPQLDMADCFCATKFGGWVREVPCTYDPVCNTESCILECDIHPVKCNWWEKGKVLQRFVEFRDLQSEIMCVPCSAGCSRG